MCRQPEETLVEHLACVVERIDQKSDFVDRGGLVGLGLEQAWGELRGFVSAGRGRKQATAGLEPQRNPPVLAVKVPELPLIQGHLRGLDPPETAKRVAG